LNQKSSKYNPAIRAELDNEDWDNILPRVLKYAVARSKRYYWLGYVVEPEELVHEAISLAYGKGKNETYRNWNKKNYPKLEDFLISIIESITSHKADHAMRIKIKPLFNEDGTLNDFEENISSEWTKNKENLNSPEDEIIKSESLLAIIDKLKTISEEDEEIGMLILCIEDGISRPRDISKETGYDVNRVNNIFKRLRTKLKEFKPSSMRYIQKKGEKDERR
jgi:DNA-directed RNA polymerase specialized sigma24 family protein